MEWKIGEIKQVNGEWYQCVEGTGCYQCAFNNEDNACQADNPYCLCRSDKKQVVFKKLEKVGEPYKHYEKFYQCYKLPMETEIRLLPNNCYPIGKDNLVEIEIKQTKEDMEENKLNLKPFDIQKAREGKPVCTRDGRKARIICFDRRLFYKNVSYPILALVEGSDGEDYVCGYNEKGKVLIEDGAEYKDDLMMLPEKKEGWAVIRKSDIYETEGQAEEVLLNSRVGIMIRKINWVE